MRGKTDRAVEPLRADRRTATHDGLLVLGSLNANPADREADRSDIRPAQIYQDGELCPLSGLRSWGELGISSLAWHADRPLQLYVSTGADLRLLDLETGAVRQVDVPRLRDVHEMTVIGERLWLANTGRDEAVAVDPAGGRVDERIELAALANGSRHGERADGPTDADASQDADRFHCNQVLEGFDGRLYALVHHVDGRQRRQRIAGRLLKRQGDGGVLDLETGEGTALELKAPHTVRKIGRRYWVLDSGNARLNVYDRDWRPAGSVETVGWGRGGALSRDGRRYYVGISATRKRYLGLVPGRGQRRNLIQVFTTADLAAAGEIAVPRVEQVNNVYVLSREQASGLVRHFG